MDQFVRVFGRPLRRGEFTRHPDGRVVKIIDVAEQEDGRVEHFDYVEVYEDGTRGREGRSHSLIGWDLDPPAVTRALEASATPP